jgi:hypothetical protein
LTGFVARRAYSPSDVGFRRQAAFFFRFNTVTAFGEDDTAAVRWAGPTEPATFSDRCVRERGSADKFHLHVSPKLNAGGRTGTHARARARRRSRAGLSRRSLRGWNTRKLRLRPRYDRTGRAAVSGVVLLSVRLRVDALAWEPERRRRARPLRRRRVEIRRAFACRARRELELAGFHRCRRVRESVSRRIGARLLRQC